MFKQYTIEYVLEIPPDRFGYPIKDSAFEILSKEYQGIIDPNLGFIISITEIIEIGPGRIIHGSAGTFHNVKFSVLTYNPIQNEVVEGEVVELVDFGAFIRLGPSDGLCHISQILDGKVRFDNKVPQLIEVTDKEVPEEEKRVLREHDFVRARIIAVSQGGGRSGKLGLTMRQPFLGKFEWIQKAINEIYSLKEEAAKNS
ncbi:MAG: DNA-directed RNA polymerase [Promethearchaeota archaeon]